MKIISLVALCSLMLMYQRADCAYNRDDRLFGPANLVAWWIVPYDAKKRTPEERAEMLSRIGSRRLAYDWRAEHLPTLDRELDALKKRRIRMEAIWFPVSLEPEKDEHA